MALDRTVTTTIDTEVCIGCGECVRVCPQDTISMQNKKACITGDNSLTCDHCRAACVSGAVFVGGIDESLSRFESFQAERKWLPHGKYDIVGLVDVIKLPEDESVYAVIAVGYPDEKYQYVTGRKPALIRTITLSP